MATMATDNYNEVTHNKLVDWSVIDPMYKWDCHFPEHISRLTINEDFHHNRSSSQKRRAGRGRQRNANRYKTQPITFDEIKEVDEDKTVDKTDGNEENKDGLKSQFTAFSRSMDGLVPGYPGLSRKKNQPLKPSPLVTGTPTTVPQATKKKEETGDISIRVPQHCNDTASSSSSSNTSPLTSSTTSSQTSQPTKEQSSSTQSENSPSGATSPKVTSEELSAIGLTALPDLPQDSSRARRAKRRQKKLIEEEPEFDQANNSTGTG